MLYSTKNKTAPVIKPIKKLMVANRGKMEPNLIFFKCKKFT